MIKLGLHGSSGNMGATLIRELESSSFEKDCTLACSYSRKSGQNNLDNLFSLSDVVIDFTLPDSLDRLLFYANKHKKPLVIGTTGFSKVQLRSIEKCSKNVAILRSYNFSIGANLMRMMSGILAKTLGSAFDVGIMDIHRSGKVDSPSGTSKMIIDEIKKSSAKTNISCSSIRIGDVFGEHNVIFEENKDSSETIKITHVAKNRNIFAIGAIKSAIWIANKKPRLYTIDEFLSDKMANQNI